MIDAQVPAPPPELEPGIRAARKRLGLSQDEAADRIGANRSTFKTWDRGHRRPRDPEMIQAIAEALRTPIDVLWPPEKNPHVAESLRILREQESHEIPEDALAPLEGGDALWSSPSTSVPDPREVLRTLDGVDDHQTRRTPRRHRRFIVPSLVGMVLALVAGTAIAAAGDDGDPPPPTRTGPTAAAVRAQQEWEAQHAALGRARARGDFDAAISAASALGDDAAVGELRTAAATVLVRRARSAADRGDLTLAKSRLSRAQTRYGDTPASAVVRRRITAIERARRTRAAQRRTAAKQRAAARAAAAAAAARRIAPSTTNVTPVPQPATPKDSPAPAPSSSAPAPSSGGGSKSGSRSEKTVDPGLY